MTKKEPTTTVTRDPKPGTVEALAKSLLRRVRPYDNPKRKQQ